MNYFLFDACTLVPYYCTDEDEAVRRRVTRLFAAHSQKKAFLYVPNFCVAEVLRAFAKKCWAEKLYGKGREADEAFEKFKNVFLDDVINSRILYSYELSRRHLLRAHEVYERAFKMSHRGGAAPSAFDVLLLSVGLDLAHVHGRENLWVVTQEAPVTDVCRNNRAHMPQVINLGAEEIPKQALAD